MDLISAESIRRPEVIRWHERIIGRYKPPEGLGLTVFLPCSARKPYSKSKSHMAFVSHIRRGAGAKYPLVHEVSLTSPLGLVPRELEEVYPAAHYDVPVTGFWSEEEKEIVRSLLKDYMEKTSSPAIGHVTGVYAEICKERGIETTDGDPSLLEVLVSDALTDIAKVHSFSYKLRRVRAVCDFQFGKGAHRYLLEPGSLVKGFQIYDGKGMLLATVDRDSGLLALSLDGAKRVSQLNDYTVELSFKPETNSIFCAGISRACPGIRPGDEVVVVYKDEVVGAGRAVLSGEEMEIAEKGLGINLRHRRR